MNRVLFCALFALCLTSCTTPSGSQRPDLSGRYLLDRINSKLEAIDISSLQSATIVFIEHREPAFKFQRTFTVGGRDQTFSYDLTSDGKEVKTQSAGQDQYSRLYWEGDALVFAMRSVSATGESTDTVHYRLTDGGGQLEAEESVRGPGSNYDNHWVFARQ